VLALAALVFSAACASTCTKNVAATKACAKVAGSTACKACCGMHGSSVTSYVSNCTCYQ
jgi:hypothetical protein